MGLHSYVDTYEVQMALGPGKTRDIAIELMNGSASDSKYLMPIVGIASHTHRDGVSPPLLKSVTNIDIANSTIILSLDWRFCF